MKTNTLKIIDNGSVVASTSFNIIDIKDSYWVDFQGNELIQQGRTPNTFYGEEVKIKLITEGATDGTKLTLEVKGVLNNNFVVLEEDERQSLIISLEINSNEAISEPFYLSPKWYDKNNPITYVFDIKPFNGESYIAEDLPMLLEHQLKPIGFGKPDEFKIDKAKGYLLVKQADGTKIAYTSGDRLDILQYQEWFENDSDELDFENKKQVNSYFKSVYDFKPFGWAPRGEFGSKDNRKRVITAFEKEGKKHGIPPSVLYLYAVGEGMIEDYNRKITDRNREKFKKYRKYKNIIDLPVYSFVAFGLDFFDSSTSELIKEGYLPKDFNCSGKDLKHIGLGRNPPNEFIQGSDYAISRQSDGVTKILRREGIDTFVDPVWFTNLETGIVGACAVYARACDLAKKNALDLGWENLNLDELMFFGYFKIQKPNANLLSSYKLRDANFLNGSYDVNRNAKSLSIASLAYQRWVSWRYVSLGKYFSK